MEFPRLVYKSADDHMLAEDKEHFDILVENGYFATVPEALSGEHEADDESPATRSELEQKAKELGIQFHHRLSDEKLGRLISDALKDQDELV